MPEPAFDPYRKWLGIPPDQQPPTHYRLLGLADFEKDPDVIDNATQRCSAHVKTFQVGEQAELAKRIIKELAEAQRCLLNPKTRAAYDAELRKSMPAPAATKPNQAVPVVAAKPIPKAQAIPAAPTEEPHPLAELGNTRTTASPRRYQARAKRTNMAPIFIMLGLAACLLIAGLVYVLKRERTPVAKPTMPSNTITTPPPTTIKIKKKKPPKVVSMEGEPGNANDQQGETSIGPNETPDDLPDRTDPTDRPNVDDDENQPEPPAPQARQPVPVGDSLQAARRWMRETFRDHLSQTKTPAEKRSAVEALIEGAGGPDQEPANRFVLLQRANELAIDLVDVKTLTDLNRELSKQFETDYYNLQGTSLTQAERKASSPEQGRELYAAAGELLDETRKLRRFDVAVVAAEVSGRSARRAGEIDAQRAAEEIQKDLRAKLTAQQAGTEPGPLESLPLNKKVTAPKLPVAGLIHHWKFEEGEGDDVLCSVSKVRSPMRGAPKRVNGRIGAGLELSAGNYVEVLEGPNFDKSDLYTLAAWVKTSNPEPMAVLARIDEGQSFKGFELSIVDLKPNAVLVNAHPANSLIVSGTEAFSADQWHHVAATHDGSGRAIGMKVYVDGVQQSPNTQYDTLSESTLVEAPLHIGQRKASLAFIGLVDDVRIYNRALSAAEIAALVKEAGDEDQSEESKSE